MKSKTLRISGIVALLVGLLLWIHGGAQIGFYKTYYEIDVYDEILEISGPQQVEAFLPGIETLFAGFAAFVGLVSASIFFERRTTAEES